jgi:hypothetical protein
MDSISKKDSGMKSAAEKEEHHGQKKVFPERVV